MFIHPFKFGENIVLSGLKFLRVFVFALVVVKICIINYGILHIHYIRNCNQCAV